MNGFHQRVVYNLFVKLENGEEMLLAAFEDLSRGKRLIKSLNVHWPGEYFVKNSVTGENIDLE